MSQRSLDFGDHGEVVAICADAIAGLSNITAQSIHTIITSPPYWGLRDYGLAPIVWAPAEFSPMSGLAPIRVPEWVSPDRYRGCRHIWGAWTERHETREKAVAGKPRTTDRCYGGAASRRFDGPHHTHLHGKFCRICGAWRGCLGLEPTPELYIGHLVQVFRAARRVLRGDGTLWLNLGDRYLPASAAAGAGGLKRKDLVGIPWRAAYALQADGWYLRSDIVWAKGVSFSRTDCGNVMPESVTDRPVRGHESIFLLAKSADYYYDHYAVQEDAVTRPQRRLTPRSSARDRAMRQDKVYPYRLMDEPGRQQARRNLRDVWRINTRPFKGAHFAGFPADLVRPMIRASTPEVGCCAQCHAPRKRVLRRERLKASRSCERDKRTGGVLPEQRWDRTGMTHLEVSEWLAANPLEHVGWEPGCDCPADTSPARVLDPFAGSGTTGMVAAEEGRRAVLIEPQEKYHAIIHARLDAAGIKLLKWARIARERMRF